jgi:hypothetical protein
LDRSGGRVKDGGGGDEFIQLDQVNERFDCAIYDERAANKQ